MTRSYRVLLTDGQQRKTLAAARSLDRAGHTVLVADVSWASLTRFSRAAHGAFRSPPPARPVAYGRWLERTIRQAAIDVVIPMDDDSTAALLAFPGAARTLLPDPEAFRIARDKWETAGLARDTGVPVPPTRLAGDGWPGPGVLRPRRGSGGRGFRRVSGPGRLTGATADAYIWQADVAFIRKWDVGLLYGPEREPYATFVQQELRWFPHPHGASTRQLTAVRPDLEALAIRLLAPLGWRGPVEVEFLEDASGGLWLAEINPRYWASLALAIEAGVDFPRLHVELAAGLRPRPSGSYRTDLECRWTVPADWLATLFGSPPATARGTVVMTDILAPDDPGATLGLAMAALGHAWRPGFLRTLFRW